MLVRHRARDSSYHLLPGGGVDYRETLEQALVREVAEETGLHVEIGRPLLINDTIDPEGAGTSSTSRSWPPWSAARSPNIRWTHVSRRSTSSTVSALAALDLRPPLADAIAAALAGSDTSARYLGSLFTEGTAPDALGRGLHKSDALRFHRQERGGRRVDLLSLPLDA